MHEANKSEETLMKVEICEETESLKLKAGMIPEERKRGALWRPLSWKTFRSWDD